MFFIRDYAILCFEEVLGVVETTLKKRKAICVRHRVGQDWKDYCAVWRNSTDGYHGNCLPDPSRSLSMDITVRLTPSETSAITPTTLFYIGDSEPPDDLSRDRFSVVTRKHILREISESYASENSRHILIKAKDQIIDLDSAMLKTILLQSHQSKDYHAICELVDFLLCSTNYKFIGNSVEAWSALQILHREGKGASWYNSRSVPLLFDLSAAAITIPIVYTYNKASSSERCKYMLMASILSVRTHMPRSDIYVIYFGTHDDSFRSWLESQGVIICDHDPTWIPEITDMFHHFAGKDDSNLFESVGNYIGTWQRIDIPLFVDAEYALYLDSDTIVVAPFDYTDFGKEMTPSIALSSEMNEKVKLPMNAGVLLLNIPYLRETYPEFLHFIKDHRNGQEFMVEMPWGLEAVPSDQGAYREFYASTRKFLDPIFNYKPYWSSDPTVAKILHFHGAKPHDYINQESCPKAAKDICEKDKSKTNLCWGLYEFGKAMLAHDQGSDILNKYCESSCSDSHAIRRCVHFFETLVNSDEERRLVGGECLTYLRVQ